MPHPCHFFGREPVEGGVARIGRDAENVFGGPVQGSGGPGGGGRGLVDVRDTVERYFGF